MQLRKILSIRYGLAVSVALITFLVYLPTVQNDFVEWDDNQYIFENTHIRSIGPAFFRWAFTTFHAANWHPLTWISHALDYAVWGLDPLGHHLTNNILHAVNTFWVVLLVVKLIEAVYSRQYAVSRRAKGGEKSVVNSKKEGEISDRPGTDGFSPLTTHYSQFTIHDSRFTLIAAAATGLLFGLHPIHVESVAWVSERKDLLCALFYLLSVLKYMSYRTHKTYTAYLLSLLFFTLALLSKPMAVSLPVVLLVLDWCPFSRINSLKTFGTAMLGKLPFIALSFGSSVVTVLAQKEGGTMQFMENVPLPARLLVSSKALLSYLSHMILPVNLVPYYPYPHDVSLLLPEYILAVLMVIGISASCVYFFKKQKLWTAVWGYYVITLLPVLGLVQVGSQAMADRYTYLPGIGPFFLAGLGAGWLHVRYGGPRGKGLSLKLVAAGASMLVLFALPYLTIRQINVWRNSITLWSYVIEKKPVTNFFAYSNRGVAYIRTGDFDRAISDLRKAIDLNPEYPDAYSNLGAAYYNKGMLDEAVFWYRAAIRLKPAYFTAHRNLAVALYMNGRFTEALEHYFIAANLRPYDAGAHKDLGAAYAALGRHERAIEHLQTALRLEPDFADAHYNLAVVYNILGRKTEARKHFEAAGQLNPHNASSPGPVSLR